MVATRPNPPCAVGYTPQTTNSVTLTGSTPAKKKKCKKGFKLKKVKGKKKCVKKKKKS